LPQGAEAKIREIIEEAEEEFGIKRK